MDKDQVEGTAKGVVGNVQSKIGDVTGDAKTKVEGTVRKVAGDAQKGLGDAKEAVADAAEDVSGQIAGLRAQVEELMSARVKPAVSKAADTVNAYAHQAGDAIAEGAGQAKEVVKGHPLSSLLGVAVLGFLIGRVAGSLNDR